MDNSAIVLSAFLFDVHTEITRDKKPLEYNKWGAMFKKFMQTNVAMKKWAGRSAMPQWSPVNIPP